MKKQNIKPFLSFLSSSTFIVFLTNSYFNYLHSNRPFKEDLLPDLYFPEVLIAICLAGFYAIFSVKTL